VLRVFCCVWALDKLNAAFHGRPVLVHERDSAREENFPHFEDIAQAGAWHLRTKVFGKLQMEPFRLSSNFSIFSYHRDTLPRSGNIILSVPIASGITSIITIICSTKSVGNTGYINGCDFRHRSFRSRRVHCHWHFVSSTVSHDVNE